MIKYLKYNLKYSLTFLLNPYLYKTYDSVEKCLNRKLRKTAPYDNRVIQNAMYAYMNNANREMFDYDNMIEWLGGRK